MTPMLPSPFLSPSAATVAAACAAPDDAARQTVAATSLHSPAPWSLATNLTTIDDMQAALDALNAAAGATPCAIPRSLDEAYERFGHDIDVIMHDVIRETRVL